MFLSETGKSMTLFRLWSLKDLPSCPVNLLHRADTSPDCGRLEDTLFKNSFA